MLKTYQPWQGARVTVMPETARRLAINIRNLHRELNINQFVIGFATGIVWTDEQIADYSFALKETFEYLLQERIDNENPRLRIGLIEVGLIDEAYAEKVAAAEGFRNSPLAENGHRWYNFLGKLVVQQASSP